MSITPELPAPIWHWGGRETHHSQDARHDLLKRYRKADLIAFVSQVIGVANSVAENCREMAIEMLIVSGHLPHHEAERVNMPTLLGAAQGALHAESIEQDGLCTGCALRVGAAANQSVTTTADISYCATPGERQFMCHIDGLDDRGEPTQPCRGYARLLAARRKAQVLSGAAE